MLYVICYLVFVMSTLCAPGAPFLRRSAGHVAQAQGTKGSTPKHSGARRRGSTSPTITSSKGQEPDAARRTAVHLLLRVRALVLARVSRREKRVPSQKAKKGIRDHGAGTDSWRTCPGAPRRQAGGFFLFSLRLPPPGGFHPEERLSAVASRQDVERDRVAIRQHNNGPSVDQI